MAPPANRRSGFSRRAQYSTFINYAVGVLGAVIGGGLLIVSIAQPDFMASMQGSAADAARPGAQTVSAGRGVTKTLFEDVSGIFRTASERARLERELALAKTRLVELRAVDEENRRLKGLLGISETQGAPVAAARLTSSTASSTRRFATIGAGRNKGVAKGMPVRSALGLVGRVLEVGAASSKVLLITDTESIVPVRRLRDGVPAFAQGAGDGTIRIRLINLGINPLKKGDVMVTSGSGGLYRPGTPFAVISEVVRDGAVARVLANPSDTDFAIVEPVWAPDAPPPAQTAEQPKP